MNPKYSVVIPVYNRPDEVDELLQSLTGQTYKDFEVVVVEDGSSIPCKQVVEKYEGKLDVHYFEKPNSGPGQTRNYAVERSRGEYLLILDSDCICLLLTWLRWKRNCSGNRQMRSVVPTGRTIRLLTYRKPSIMP